MELKDEGIHGPWDDTRIGFGRLTGFSFISVSRDLMDSHCKSGRLTKSRT